MRTENIRIRKGSATAVPGRRKVTLAVAWMMVLATGALAEYTSFKEAFAAGEDLLWKQTRPFEAQGAFEQAARLGKQKNDKAQAEVRIAVCLIKQNRHTEGIARLKTVLEEKTAGEGRTLRGRSRTQEHRRVD